MTEALFMGVDVGASTAKVMMIGETANCVATAIERTGVDFTGAAQRAINSVYQQTGISTQQVAGIAACGYGRRNVVGAGVIKTEIACHAKGACHFEAGPLTVLDIGGQDTKVIRVSESGAVIDFKMNRKCASGTGSFLEEMGRRMDIPLSDMSSLAEQAKAPAPIGAFCTVFAASEMLAAARNGTPKSEIARGVFAAMATRVRHLADFTGNIVLTGGVVAHQPVFVELLGDSLEGTVAVPPLAQYTGALGAALFARDAHDFLGEG